MSKEIKVEFAPGCFNDFEGTQEELDELVAEIHRMAQTGELFENVHELDFEELDDLAEDYNIVIDACISSADAKRKLH